MSETAEQKDVVPYGPQQTIRPPDSIDEFFAGYQGFPYRPAASIMTEFRRMCDHFGWDRADSERQIARQRFRGAMVTAFNHYYGTDIGDLSSWQKLCRVIAITPLPQDVASCKAAVERVHVNLVDLVETHHTGEPVAVFETAAELREYTARSQKYFPRDSSYSGGVLKALLREILTLSHEDVVCRIHVKPPADINDAPASLSMVADDVKKMWIRKISEEMLTRSKPVAALPRPWDFVLGSDGSVDLLSRSSTGDGSGPPSSGMYPPHYRIPPATIRDLGPQERVERQELFAFATLLYEIGTGRRPFAELDGHQVQQRYAQAHFPDDVKALPVPLFLTILAGWSVEFSRTLKPTLSLALVTSAAGNYVQQHPFLAAAQITGLVLSVAAAVTVPILGAVGFGALGPVAGSAAAAWQSSIGAVSAGSLFAWCQSAAMGGAAASTICAVGAASGGVTALATAAGAAAAALEFTSDDVDVLMNKFREVFRQSG